MLGQRQYALNGVLNGIDYETWSPEKDKLIPHNYSKTDLTGKLWCKADLQKELGLPQDADRPLIAFIGRLDSQKGADLILAASHWIMQQVRTIVDCCCCTPVLMACNFLVSRCETSLRRNSLV